MRIKLFLNCVLVVSSLAVYAECNPATSSNYNATKWYRDSAEKTA